MTLTPRFFISTLIESDNAENAAYSSSAYASSLGDGVAHLARDVRRIPGHAMDREAADIDDDGPPPSDEICGLHE